MANYAMAAADRGLYAKSTVAATQDVVTVAQSGANRPRVVEVISNGAAALYLTDDDSNVTVADPLTIELPAGIFSKVQLTIDDASPGLKLKSAGVALYSIRRVRDDEILTLTS